jgi:hypothetical protein
MATYQLKQMMEENEIQMNEDGILNVPGACNECIAGQNGELGHPFGQGHTYCAVVPEIIRQYIAHGNLFTRFNNNRWEIVAS